MVDAVLNEELGLTINIHFTCACGEQVYYFKDNESFGCLHCDGVCNKSKLKANDCEKCTNLMEFEAPEFDEG